MLSVNANLSNQSGNSKNQSEEDNSTRQGGSAVRGHPFLTSTKNQFLDPTIPKNEEFPPVPTLSSELVSESTNSGHSSSVSKRTKIEHFHSHVSNFRRRDHSQFLEKFHRQYHFIMIPP